VCIADFGLSCTSDDHGKIFEKCGTPGYMDPEVLNGLPFNDKSDIFSLGVILYNLLTGKSLFEGEDIHEVLQKNTNC
jgi:serine/threonine protein kinase